MSIEVRQVEFFDETAFADLVQRNLQSERIFIEPWNHLGSGDPSFQNTGKTIRIGAFDGESLIGLSWGRSESKSRFAMHMSLVESAYRKRGIYSEMLQKVLSLTTEYDEIDSYHHIFNNEIIALKLKKGFYIVGTDHCIPIGPRVHLRLYNNKKLFDFMRFRTGLIPLTDP